MCVVQCNGMLKKQIDRSGYPRISILYSKASLQTNRYANDLFLLQLQANNAYYSTTILNSTAKYEHIMLIFPNKGGFLVKWGLRIDLKRMIRVKLNPLISVVAYSLTSMPFVSRVPLILSKVHVSPANHIIWS